MQKIKHKFIRSAFVSTSLLFHPLTTNANEKPVEYNVYGSANTLSQFSPNTLKQAAKVAQKNILVLTRKDLLSPEEFKKKMIFEQIGIPYKLPSGESASRLRNFFGQFKNILPENYLALDDKLWKRMKFLTSRILDGQYESHAIPNYVTCIVTVPSLDENLTGHLTHWAGLPKSMENLLQADITPKEIVELVLIHEASHCRDTTTFTGNSLKDALAMTPNEDKADKVYYDSKRDKSPHSESAILTIQMMRDLCAIRCAGGLFHGKFDWHAPLYSNTPADTLLSLKIARFLAASITTKLYGDLLEKNNPEIQIFERSEKKRESSPIVTTVEQPGLYMNQQYPFTEYANLKAIRDKLFPHLDDYKKTLPHLRVPLAVMQDAINLYIKSFEGLIPSALSNDMARRQHQAASEWLTPTNIAILMEPLKLTDPAPLIKGWNKDFYTDCITNFVGDAKGTEEVLAAMQCHIMEPNNFIP